MMDPLTENLVRRLDVLCKKVAYKKYSKPDVEKLFELTKIGRYPKLISELAESFGMMMVKVEAREYKLEHIINHLEELNTDMACHSGDLQEIVSERTSELEKKNERLQGEISERLRVEEELQKANEKFKELASIDGLTHVANRRKFDEVFLEELARMKREGTPLSLLLVDVDFFKLYNDTYGHLHGDDCLRAVAHAMGNNAKRPGDLVARYGGEEFVVILSDTDEEGACHVAESIRRDVENLAIEHSTSTISGVVTISLGVATAQSCQGYSVEDFLDTADIALYEAKSLGRNRSQPKTLTEQGETLNIAVSGEKS